MGGGLSQHNNRQLERYARVLDRWIKKTDRELEWDPSQLVSFMVHLHKMTLCESDAGGFPYNLIRDSTDVNSLKRFIDVCKQGSREMIFRFRFTDCSGALYPQAAVLAALIARRLDLVEHLLTSTCDTYNLFMQCVLNRDLWSTHVGTELLEDTPSLSNPNTRVLVHWAIDLSRRCDPARKVLQMLWPHVSTDLDVYLKNDIVLKCIWDGDFEFFAFLKTERIFGRCDSNFCKAMFAKIRRRWPLSSVTVLCPRALMDRCVYAVTVTRFRLRMLPSPIPGVLSHKQQLYRRLITFLVRVIEYGLSTQCGAACMCPYFQQPPDFQQHPSGLREAAHNGDLDLVRLLFRTGAARVSEMYQVCEMRRTRLTFNFVGGRPEPLDRVEERKENEDKVFSYVQGVVKNPRKLSRLCVLTVSHAVGGGSDRFARASWLPIPRLQREAVLMHDVIHDFLAECGGGL